MLKSSIHNYLRAYRNHLLSDAEEPFIDSTPAGIKSDQLELWMKNLEFWVKESKNRFDREGFGDIDHVVRTHTDGQSYLVTRGWFVLFNSEFREVKIGLQDYKLELTVINNKRSDVLAQFPSEPLITGFYSVLEIDSANTFEYVKLFFKIQTSTKILENNFSDKKVLCDTL